MQPGREMIPTALRLSVSYILLIFFFFLYFCMIPAQHSVARANKNMQNSQPRIYSAWTFTKWKRVKLISGTSTYLTHLRHKPKPHSGLNTVRWWLLEKLPSVCSMQARFLPPHNVRMTFSVAVNGLSNWRHAGGWILSPSDTAKEPVSCCFPLC